MKIYQVCCVEGGLWDIDNAPVVETYVSHLAAMKAANALNEDAEELTGEELDPDDYDFVVREHEVVGDYVVVGNQIVQN